MSCERKLNLIFEFVDKDLKMYMDELKAENEQLKSTQRHETQMSDTSISTTQVKERNHFNYKSIVY